MTLGADIGLAGLALLVSLLSGELAGPGLFGGATTGRKAAVRRALVAPKPNLDMTDAEAALQGDDIAFARLVVRSFESMHESMDSLRGELAGLKRRRTSKLDKHGRDRGGGGQQEHGNAEPNAALLTQAPAPPLLLPPEQTDSAYGRTLNRYVFKL